MAIPMQLPTPEGSSTGHLYGWAFKLVDALRAVVGGDSAPVGSIQQFIGDTPPQNWMVLDGRLLKRAQYKNLFSAIGTKWNQSGDASDSFRLPDARGRYARGAVAAETYGGTSQVTVGLTNLPSVGLTVTDPGHVHTFTGSPHTHTVTDPGHAHAISGSPQVGAGSVSLAGGGIATTQGMPGTLSVGSATTGITLGSTTAGGSVGTHTTGVSVHLDGGGTPLDVAPPYFAIQWIIKAS